jgi:hypothetical protein
MRERPLEDVAVENAVEGCVRETWGAVLASWQSRTAADPEIRAAFASIARDEMRHAALAWSIHRWAQRSLDDAALARVTEAGAAAVAEVLDSPVVGFAPHIALLGLPHGTGARALITRSRGLWAG